MATIRWTREAGDRLEDIFNYIAQDNPGAAAKVVAGIYEKIQMLADFPGAGHMYRKEPEGDVRILLFGHYRIAYLWRAKGDVVEILGIFHGAMDISRYV